MNHSPDTPQDRSSPDGPRQWKSKELRELEAQAFPYGPLEALHAGK